VGAPPSSATVTHTVSEINEVVASEIATDLGAGVVGALNIIPDAPVLGLTRPGLRSAMDARFGKQVIMDRKFQYPSMFARQPQYKCTNATCPWKIRYKESLYIDKRYSDLITPRNTCFFCDPFLA